MNISIIYWSGTGNTEKMAELISEGAKSVGANVEVKSVDTASVDDVVNADIAVLGCPSMGSEELEESEFAPFNESILDSINGKKIAIFGSYDWGEGDWLRTWKEQLENSGANVVAEPLAVNLTPEGDTEQECIDFGKNLA